jgi:hypothetical protein
MGFSPYTPGSPLGALGYYKPPKRKIFVSYHHGNDQAYYNQFSSHFHDLFEVIHDNSLDRQIGSDNSEYVIRAIRERFISGTSCTLVLCGADTPYRKFVDWEIKATLDKEHALIGVILPTARVVNGKIIVPDRFVANVHSGFAHTVNWQDLYDANIGLNHIVNNAVLHAQANRARIDNSIAMMTYNKSSAYAY